MEVIEIFNVDSTYIRISTDYSIHQELYDHFSFMVPNFRFMPMYKNKMWDGKIRLYNTRTRCIYKGLINEVVKFAESNDYKIIIHDGLDYTENYSLLEAEEFYKSLNLPEEYESRDYQLESFAHCVKHKRSFFVSPTGSGKSLIIYLLLNYYSDKKTLIIVDSITLLLQMFTNFKEYGFDVENNVHLISAGKDKYSNKRILVSTWQSACKQNEKWFNQFDMVIGDEAHLYTAKELTKIMTSLKNCELRFGFTGSTDGTTTSLLVLQGLFGPYKQIVTVKDLQKNDTLAESVFKCIILEYTENERKEKRNYASEIKFLFENPKRNKFLSNLALSLNGNTLLLFSRIEHGKLLYDYISKKSKHKVYYVSGEVEGQERERIRKEINECENSITIASLKTFSKGVDIPNLNNIIFGSPTKAQNTILQSIGRGLRKSKVKSKCTYFDISDDLSWKKYKNYSMKHLLERFRIYNSEQHSYKIYKVKL